MTQIDFQIVVFHNETENKISDLIPHLIPDRAVVDVDVVARYVKSIGVKRGRVDGAVAVGVRAAVVDVAVADLNVRTRRGVGPAKNASFERVFPVSVPSLSW